jgi:hypothetical protein
MLAKMTDIIVKEKTTSSGAFDREKFAERDATSSRWHMVANARTPNRIAADRKY